MNYSGILALAAYAALVLIGLALERIGVPLPYLGIAMSVPVVAAAVAVVFATTTMREGDYLSGGKASGGTETGAWIALQSAALVIVAATYIPFADTRAALAVAAMAGAALAGFAISPALRQSGATTLPELLYRRLGGAWPQPELSSRLPFRSRAR
jgi:Na+(H+)/acetate symporter ActP